MAFTGTPVVKQISDSIVRITGVSLGGGASGTIGFAGATGSAPDIHLPHAFQAQHYKFHGADVPFSDAIDVTVKPAGTTADFEIPGVVKSGEHVTDWRATLSNGFASVTPALEIYVKFHS